MKTTMKTVPRTISFLIKTLNWETKMAFKGWCAVNDLNMSQAFQLFMEGCIAGNVDPWRLKENKNLIK